MVFFTTDLDLEKNHEEQVQQEDSPGGPDEPYTEIQEEQSDVGWITDKSVKTGSDQTGHCGFVNSHPPRGAHFILSVKTQ